MTTPPPRTGANSTTALVVALAVMFSVVVAASALIIVSIEDGARATTSVGLLLAAFAALVPQALTLARVQDVAGKVEGQGEVVRELGNGGLDAKIRAGVAEVLREEMIDPNAKAQLARDGVRRQALETLLARQAGTELPPPAGGPSTGSRRSS